MSDDIVTRLRRFAYNSGPSTESVCVAALTEIERLRAALAAQQAPAPAEKRNAGTLLQVPASGRAAHGVSDEKGNDPQSTQHSSATAAPAGWRLVPVEPTEAQMLAGEKAFVATARPGATWAEHTGNVYRAMLAAAPTHTGDAPETMTRG